jgi:hypothetical protein
VVSMSMHSSTLPNIPSLINHSYSIILALSVLHWPSLSEDIHTPFPLYTSLSTPCQSLVRLETYKTVKTRFDIFYIYTSTSLSHTPPYPLLARPIPISRYLITIAPDSNFTSTVRTTFRSESTRIRDTRVGRDYEVPLP